MPSKADPAWPPGTDKVFQQPQGGKVPPNNSGRPVNSKDTGPSGRRVRSPFGGK
jgi:hypothetical protein